MIRLASGTAFALLGMLRKIVAGWVGASVLCACGPARSPQEIQVSYELRLQRLTDSATGALVRVSCANVAPGRPCGLLVDELLEGFPVEGKLVEYASKVCDEDAAEGMSAMCLDRFRVYFRTAVARRYPRADRKVIETYCEVNDGDCDLGSVASLRLWELLHLQSHNKGVAARYEVAAEAMADRNRREVEEAQAEEEAAQSRRHALGAALEGLGQGMSAAGQGLGGASRTPAALPSGGVTGAASVGCTSDYQCSFGFYCAKEQFASSGSCARAVNDLGTPTLAPPRLQSVGPGQAECVFTVGDCPIGFECVKNHCMKQ